MIRIAWEIHNRCNYRCPYCWFAEEASYQSFNSKHISAEEWLRAWECLYEKYGAAQIDITGGEPFVYPDFVMLVKTLSNRHTIKITTNLSIQIDKIPLELNSKRVKIISSFHPSFADLEVFLEKAALLKEEGFGNTVVYVAYPPQLKQVSFYQARFEEKAIHFNITPFCGNYNGLTYPSAYNEKEKKILSQYLGTEKRVRYTLNKENPQGRLCRAGQEFILLLEDGRVARCGRLKNKPFTNFFDKDFHFYNEPLPCEADFCPCDDHDYLV